MVTDTLPPVVSYQLAAGGRHDRATLERREQRDGSVLWGIFEGDRTCLVEPAHWSYEPMPSSRTDEYLAKARRPFDEALELWRRHLVATCGGGTWMGAVVGNTPPEACEALYDPTGVVGASADRKAVARAEWLTPATVAMAKAAWDGNPEDREVAADLDCDLRRVLALAGDDWRKGGLSRVVVADGKGFAGPFAAQVKAEFKIHGGARTVKAVCADLMAFLRTGRTLPACFATLALEGDEAVATVTAELA